MQVRLDHLNMSVRNLEESVLWYKNVFGFEVAETGVSSAGLKFAIVALNDNMLAMYEIAGKEKPNLKYSDPNYQIFHFGLRVNDLNSWLNKIEDFNIEFRPMDIVNYPNSKSWYLADPSGHEIEVSWTGGEVLRFS